MRSWTCLIDRVITSPSRRSRPTSSPLSSLELRRSPRCSGTSKRILKRLTTLSECSRQLADQTGEWHIQRAIQSTGFRTRVVFKHFDGNGGIITDDYASLDHSQQAGDAFGFAESAGCVDDRIGIVANSSRKDRGQSQTDFG